MPQIAPAALGQLAHLHQLLSLIVEDLDDDACRRQFHPALAPIGWYLGQAAWSEAWWLRDRVMGEHGVVTPLAGLYGPDALPLAQRGAHLPEQDELLHWVGAWFDDTLMRLANPGMLPDHPLLEEGFLAHYLAQQHALSYEAMLMVRAQRAAARAPGELFLDNPLEPAAPSTATHEIPRGLYRVGATNAPQALDLELPPQAVELSAFRIGVRPVSNAEYLAFMEAGGYAEPAHWRDAGREWLAAAGVKAPDGWRRNGLRQWFGVGINGAYELTADAPVVGISRHEAEAYAAWAATTAPELAGACLPHEYQWEAACRLGSLDGLWEVREWCANTLEPYTGFTARPEGSSGAQLLQSRPTALRSGSIHAQPALRRASFRYGAPAAHRHIFSGVRLVLPPSA